MMLDDLRQQRWNPRAFTTGDSAAMYDQLGGSYQSPKVIQLYAQQCFGAEAALPIDNWVGVFTRWPFGFIPSKKKNYFQELFACASNWGKIERLVWLAAQARKVHSSISAEILWCIRYGGPDKAMRGANPVACKICMTHIRKVCPAYAEIAKAPVAFNTATPKGGFSVKTSAGNNTAPAQTFVSCTSSETFDEYSSRDRPSEFKAFPAAGPHGEEVTVEEFISRY